MKKFFASAVSQIFDIKMLGVLIVISGIGTSVSAAKDLQVGISDSPPIMFIDQANKRPSGFAVDVLNGVLNSAGVKGDIQLKPFASLLPALQVGDVDVVIMSPSPERLKSADFTPPFTRYGEALIVPNTDVTAYTSLSQFSGKRIGSTANGGWADVASKAGATLIPFKTVADALAALRDGRLDAVVGNRPSYEYLLKTGKYPNLHMVSSYRPVLVNELSFGVRRRDSRRLALISAALDKFKSTTQYNEILDKWGFQK
jgi:polar amino acid transport system substrate-binding protein